MTKPTMSKSRYLKGLHYLAPESSPATQVAYVRGNQIGEAAKKFFPNAVEIAFPHHQITQAARATERYVMAGKQTIFEATAINPANGCYRRIDILQQVPNVAEWELIEVKSSTAIKDYHYDDLAFQYYVFNSFYNIRKCQLMLIDNNSTHQTGTSHSKFRMEDITNEVIRRQDKVQSDITKLFETLGIDRYPNHHHWKPRWASV